jgi:hypothetical protein
VFVYIWYTVLNQTLLSSRSQLAYETNTTNIDCMRYENKIRIACRHSFTLKFALGFMWWYSLNYTCKFYICFLLNNEHLIIRVWTFRVFTVICKLANVLLRSYIVTDWPGLYKRSRCYVFDNDCEKLNGKRCGSTTKNRKGPLQTIPLSLRTSQVVRQQHPEGSLPVMYVIVEFSDSLLVCII